MEYIRQGLIAQNRSMTVGERLRGPSIRKVSEAEHVYLIGIDGNRDWVPGTVIHMDHGVDYQFPYTVSGY